MKKLLFLLLVVLSSCEVDRIINISDPGIGITTNDFDNVILVDSSTQQLYFELEDGVVVIDDPMAVYGIWADGETELDLSRIFKLCKNLNVLHSTIKTVNTGTVENFPSGMIWFDIGPGNVDGVVKMPETLEVFRTNIGNTISFDISDMPEWLITVCTNQGSQPFGVIDEGFPRDMKRFVLQGASNVSGDYGKMRKLPETFSITGENKVSNYTTGLMDFSKFKFSQFIHFGAPGYGLSMDEVDDLLIDLSKASWHTLKNIRIYGSHSARSDRSDFAVDMLLEKGVELQLN